MKKVEILEAKCRLYLLLSELGDDDITDKEIAIMYILSKDKEIQPLLKTNNPDK